MDGHRDDCGFGRTVCRSLLDCRRQLSRDVGDDRESRRALASPRLRVHQDIVLSSSMLVEGDGDVILLPATTRYESPGGGTETSTERRIIYSPEIPGRRIGSAKAEWWVFGEVMRRARPGDAGLVGLADAAAIRREIAATIPLYAGIETLQQKGDAVQWGGRLLYEDGRFATSDGKAHFAPVTLRGRAPPTGTFVVSTRRGKQFNSMVQRVDRPAYRRPARGHPHQRGRPCHARDVVRRTRAPAIGVRHLRGHAAIGAHP